MAYQFPIDVGQEISAHMASGRFQTEDDVLREALRALSRRNAEIAAIAEGIADMEAGRVRPLREFDREFRQRNNVATDA